MERKKTEVTTAIILETRKENKDGLHPVKLRVTCNRKCKYYTIKNEYYTKERFSEIINPDSRGNNKKKRNRLYGEETRAIKIIEDQKGYFSFPAFDKLFRQNKKTDLSIETLFENKVMELEEESKIQSATLYRATIKSLKSYENNISFEKIDPKFLKKYEKYMLFGKEKEENPKEHSYTTVAIYLRNLRYIINKAIKSGVSIEYPFGNPKDGKYQIPEGKNTKKALTINDIAKLFNYKTDNWNEYYHLQYWLFSYLCNGMNMVDIANLKFKNIKQNNIEFIRQKTRDTAKKPTTIKVLLIPEVQNIIDSIGNKEEKPENYMFPIFKGGLSPEEKHKILKQHIKNTNKYVRRVARNVGIDENITTYWARHSYSTILKRSGTPIEFISEQLGHQTTKVTQSYLDSFEDEQREKYTANLIPVVKKDKN